MQKSFELYRFNSTLVTSFLKLLLFAILIIFPHSIGFPTNRLDPSWDFALNEATVKNLAFGQDIIFTHGPYSSLFTQQYHPQLFFLMLGCNLFLCITLALSLHQLSYRLGRNWPFTFMLCALPIAPSRDALFLSFPLLLVLLAALVTPRNKLQTPDTAQKLLSAAIVLMATSIGLLPLIKGTYAMISVVIVIISSTILMRKNLFLGVLLPFLYVASMLGWWFLSGQYIPNLLQYFISLGPNVSGFTEAMPLHGKRIEIQAYILSALLILVLFWRSHYLDGDKFTKIAITGTFALVYFLAFKAGFVRHDVHVLISAGTLIFSGFLLTFFLPPLRGAAVAAIATIGCILASQRYVFFDPLFYPMQIVAFYAEAVPKIGQQVLAKPALDNRFESAVSKIRSDNPLPKISGSVDIYSYDQAVPLAYGLAWQPRPIIQSFQAYTQQLANINAEHLLSENAPDNIIFALQTIDERFPSIDDAPSWPVLFSKYRFNGFSGKYALLQRRAPEDSKDIEYGQPILSGAYKLGEEIKIPRIPSGMLWAEIEIDPTQIGLIEKLVFKLPELKIFITLSDGDTKTYRLISAMSKGGFVLSPLVETTQDFVDIGYPDEFPKPSKKEIISIRVEAKGGKTELWKNTLRLKVRPLAVQSKL